MNTRPNFLILMADQLRQDAIGCYGGPAATPYLDRLAASAVRFSRAYCTSPICVASRQAFLTGLRSGGNRYAANPPSPGPVPPRRTFPEVLLERGYWTQGIGKMHFHGRHYGLRSHLTMEECVDHCIDDDYLTCLRRQGVPARFPHGLRDLLLYQPQTSGLPRRHSPNEWVADRSVGFLRTHRAHRGDEPFLLWSSWIAPHPPFAPCAPYDSLYDPDRIDLPVHRDRPLSDLPSSLWSQRARLDGAHRDDARMRRIKALYFGQITHVDHAIGRILRELEKLKLARQTVVLFISDHGEMLGDHGLGLKSAPYEPAARVPFILRWPGRTRAGRVSSDLVQLTDFFPTVLDGLGLEASGVGAASLVGRSLLGRSGGGLARPRREIAIDFGNAGKRWVAIRRGDWKYTLFAADGGREELFNLRRDPAETDNLVRRQPAIAARLRARALAWERREGLPESFKNGRFRTWPRPQVPTEDECRLVVLNEGAWPKRLPPAERKRIESFAAAFTRAIAKEKTLSPDKLSIAAYKRQVLRAGPRDPGGESLVGTPWAGAWRRSRPRSSSPS